MSREKTLSMPISFGRVVSIMTKKADSPEAKIKAAAVELSRLRARPVLVFIDDHIHGESARTVREAVESMQPGAAIDIVVKSPGGHLEQSYIIVRELRRKFQKIGVFVPSEAKSAATLICLAGDELVLGEFGELGPLDTQVEEKQRGDVPAYKSCLERFKALEQLQKYSIETFDTIVALVLDHGGMKLIDACNVATDFTGKVCGPLYGQIEPDSIGVSARNLEVGVYYTRRVLRRYRRAAFDEDAANELIRRLVWGYPSHDFVIDIEELRDLNVPVRKATEEESRILARIEDEAGLLSVERLIGIHEARPSSAENTDEKLASVTEIKS